MASQQPPKMEAYSGGKTLHDFDKPNSLVKDQDQQKEDRLTKLEKNVEALALEIAEMKAKEAQKARLKATTKKPTVKTEPGETLQSPHSTQSAAYNFKQPPNPLHHGNSSKAYNHDKLLKKAKRLEERLMSVTPPNLKIYPQQQQLEAAAAAAAVPLNFNNNNKQVSSNFLGPAPPDYFTTNPRAFHELSGAAERATKFEARQAKKHKSKRHSYEDLFGADSPRGMDSKNQVDSTKNSTNPEYLIGQVSEADITKISQSNSQTHFGELGLTKHAHHSVDAEKYAAKKAKKHAHHKSKHSKKHISAGNDYGEVSSSNPDTKYEAKRRFKEYDGQTIEFKMPSNDQANSQANSEAHEPPTTAHSKLHKKRAHFAKIDNGGDAQKCTFKKLTKHTHEFKAPKQPFENRAADDEAAHGDVVETDEMGRPLKHAKKLKIHKRSNEEIFQELFGPEPSSKNAIISEESLEKQLP